MDSMEDKLRQALYRHDCPDPLRLGEYHLDLLPPPDRQSIAEHLGFCPHCRLEVARLAGFLTATRETPGRPDEPSLLEKVQVFLVDLLAPTGGDAPRPAALRTAGDPLQDQTQFRVHRLGDYLVSITIQPPWQRGPGRHRGGSRQPGRPGRYLRELDPARLAARPAAAGHPGRCRRRLHPRNRPRRPLRIDSQRTGGGDTPAAPRA